MDYIQQHNLYQLIEVLTASLFYHQPEDPRGFLIDQLESILRLKQTGSQEGEIPNLFSPEDIDTLFDMFSKKMDTITAAQANTALQAIGIYADDPIGKALLTREEFNDLIFS
eukprot:MONOS_12991.1-p1 / transcript=MONOS_12991.1 / gene=MONOS_12991 / organism=Monocercomonoides_exilis_PA203 / gene_product=unspecified product / transcript_product=unspecified product / location=Mono_scaffold00764:573-1021(+) / protein_length=112 / sequence_SO=supercontig / SO=protein_coding / is_pseudo=false